MERTRAVVVSLALVGATLWPLVREPYDDGFPLSTYPMFASKRPTKQTYTYALGETRDGQRRTLAPIVVGTGEVLQALRVIERAAARGELAGLCTTIAKNVVEYDEFADVVAIRIVTGTHDAVDYLARDIVGREVQRTRCEVKR